MPDVEDYRGRGFWKDESVEFSLPEGLCCKCTLLFASWLLRPNTYRANGFEEWDSDLFDEWLTQRLKALLARKRAGKMIVICEALTAPYNLGEQCSEYAELEVNGRFLCKHHAETDWFLGDNLVPTLKSGDMNNWGVVCGLLKELCRQEGEFVGVLERLIFDVKQVDAIAS